MQNPKVIQNERVSASRKNANKQEWYRTQIDLLDTEGTHQMSSGSGDVSEYKRKKVNYDLFNNILDTADFEYVCEPFGAESGELPAQMLNRDISSARIKAVLGLEMKRNFNWRVVATNKEATTRKEEEQFSRVREFVIAQAMGPIKQQAEVKFQQELKGQELTPDEQRKLEEQMQAEIEAATPIEVRRYMERDHQDPAEVLSSQILEYLMAEQEVQRKFNNGFKHAALAAEEIYWVGIRNGRPMMKDINPLRFSFDRSPDMDFIQEGEWATYEYRMTASNVIADFGKGLSDKEIDKVYDNSAQYNAQRNTDALFNFDERDSEYDYANTNRVLHVVWRGLRKIGFLQYLDEETGEVQEKIVSEEYKYNELNGDIEISWEWVPEIYEGYKIDADIYTQMRPVPGQFRDINNLHYAPLPYLGAVYDDTNSKPTSLMDRMKVYQYYYNIVMYRLELLLASDKGKKVMMNIGAIPKSKGIDLKQWQYFFESTPFGWFDPSEEGSGYGDVNTMAKVLDLSVVSDIAKYVDLAEHLEQKCGKSVGITDATLGEISPSQEVGNTKQAIVQTSHILEPYFYKHNNVKKAVLQSLLEVAKVAFSTNPVETLNYVLDDMSTQVLKMDIGLLSNSTLGLFISDGGADAESKEHLKQFAHAAMQNDKAELSDVISIIRQKDSQQAEEILKASEKERRQREEQALKSQRDHESSMAEQARAAEEKAHEREKELIILKEEESRKTEIQKQLILSAGFSEDKDMDKDGVPDILELAKHGVDADIKARKQDLDEKKFSQSKKEHTDKMKMENKKLNKPGGNK